MTVCTTDEAEDRYERVIIASLTALGNLSLALGSSIDSHITGENTTSVEIAESALQGYKEIFNDKFWLNIAMHKIDSIRRTAYETITVVCNSLPAAIHSTHSVHNTEKVGLLPTQNNIPSDPRPQKPESRSNFGLNKISAAFCQILLEKNAQNIPGMFLAFLSFAKKFPQCWKYISIDQVFVSRLRTLLQECPKCTLEHLLPILGAIPSDLIAMYACGVVHVSTVRSI